MLTMRAPALLLLWAALGSVSATAQSPKDAVALAAFHISSAGLSCAACHPDGDPANAIPEAVLAVANQQCRACHGDSAQMANTSRPKLADPNINPHASHLVAVDCTVCHAGHGSVAESYCLKCHAFTMPMPKLAGSAAK